MPDPSDLKWHIFCQLKVMKKASQALFWSAGFTFSVGLLLGWASCRCPVAPRHQIRA
jgi:hypothetical protein